MPAKDKTPNRTLAIALDKSCDYKGCDSHGIVSRTNPNGTIRTRCLSHLNTERIDPNAELLRAIGF